MSATEPSPARFSQDDLIRWGALSVVGCWAASDYGWDALSVLAVGLVVLHYNRRVARSTFASRLMWTVAFAIGVWLTSGRGWFSVPLVVMVILQMASVCVAIMAARDAENRAWAQVPSTAETQDFSRLRVCTLNLCLWPRGLRNSWASALKEERCEPAGIPRFLQQHDISVCQENFAWPFLPDRWRALMAPVLEKTHTWAPPGFNALAPFHWMTSGAWTLTNRALPVVSHRFVNFHHKGLVAFEYVRPVGYDHVVLQVPRGPTRDAATLHVFNVHLLPEEGAFLDTYSVDASVQQELEQLCEAVAAIPRNHLWVLAGDLNIDKRLCAHIHQTFVARLQQASHPHTMHYYAPCDTTMNSHVQFSTAWNSQQAVDHIYSNMVLEDARVCSEETKLSDHFPVSCTLRLP